MSELACCKCYALRTFSNFFPPELNVIKLVQTKHNCTLIINVTTVYLLLLLSA